MVSFWHEFAESLLFPSQSSLHHNQGLHELACAPLSSIPVLSLLYSFLLRGTQILVFSTDHIISGWSWAFPLSTLLPFSLVQFFLIGPPFEKEEFVHCSLLQGPSQLYNSISNHLCTFLTLINCECLEKSPCSLSDHACRISSLE